MKKVFIGLVVFFLIAAAIIVLEVSKPKQISRGDVVELTTGGENARIEKKASKYKKAKEFIEPSGFINSSEFKLSDVVGKKVILIDFWTYSCINCQRTLPYINSWYEKYKDSGLEIVGVHAPEFAFEKKQENVQDAVERFGVKFPVVLDNNFATWQAYNNHNWPHKYLIDIDGFIVYDHIGEGSYEETEKEIQKALKERKEVLGDNSEISQDIVSVEVEKPSLKQSPEIYFGADRNEYLGNAKMRKNGSQDLKLPEKIELNKVYLDGRWNFEDEYAQSLGNEGRVVMKYRGKNVFMVASAKEPVEIEILRDGESLGEVSGNDFVGGVGTIQEEKLYKLIESDSSEEHIIEIEIKNPGLQIYTFTFG